MLGELLLFELWVLRELVLGEVWDGIRVVTALTLDQLEVILTFLAVRRCIDLGHEVCPLLNGTHFELRANYRIDLKHVWAIFSTVNQAFLDRETVDLFHEVDDRFLCQGRPFDLVHWVEDVSGSIVLHLRLSEGEPTLWRLLLPGQAILAREFLGGDVWSDFLHDATKLILDHNDRLGGLFRILSLLKLVLLVLLDHFELDFGLQIVEVSLRVSPEDSHFFSLLLISLLLKLLFVGNELGWSHVCLRWLAFLLGLVPLNLLLPLFFIESGEAAHVTGQFVVDVRVGDRLCCRSHGGALAHDRFKTAFVHEVPWHELRPE